jgi:hypothetical protein
MCPALVPIVVPCSSDIAVFHRSNIISKSGSILISGHTQRSVRHLQVFAFERFELSVAIERLERFERVSIFVERLEQSWKTPSVLSRPEGPYRRAGTFGTAGTFATLRSASPITLTLKIANITLDPFPEMRNWICLAGAMEGREAQILAYAETHIFNSCKCVALFPPENAGDALRS